MPRIAKPFLVILILLLLAGGVWWFFLRGDHGQEQGMQGAPPVSVAEVIVRDITEWKEFSGRLEATDIAEVKPRVSGVIEKVNFEDGQYVQKGFPLFVIDPRPYAAQLEQAKGQLAAARSAATNARLEQQRAIKLLDVRAISRREADERITQALSAEGNVKSAMAAVDVAELNMEYTKVLAPIDGKASRAEITVGNMVNTGPGAPTLTTIVAQSPIYASFEADEQTYLNSIRGIAQEQISSIPVEVGLANEEGTPHPGKVDSFDNRLSAGTGTIRVRALLPNEDHAMVPGLYARVRLGSAKPEQAVLIQEQAVGTDQSKKFVLVVGEDSKAEYRVVTLGANVEGLRVVKSGLKPGERIVVNGTQRVRPGSPVTAQEVNMETLKPLAGGEKAE